MASEETIQLEHRLRSQRVPCQQYIQRMIAQLEDEPNIVTLPVVEFADVLKASYVSIAERTARSWDR